MNAPPGQELENLPGISRAIREVNAQIARLAASDEAIVFISGEPGSERALAARILHVRSPRASKRFLRLTANWKLPADFGAQVKSAAGGAVFLNLVRDFPVDMQYILLELALDKTFTDPVSDEEISADVRLILTTTMDVSTLCETSQLLPELREVLDHAHIEIPPLSRRREDIPALARFAIQRARETGQTPAESVDRRVLAVLRAYTWPGNAEELLLVVAQAALKASGRVITLNDLPEDFLQKLPSEVWKVAKAIRAEEFAFAATAHDEEGAPEPAPELETLPAPGMADMPTERSAQEAPGIHAAAAESPALETPASTAAPTQPGLPEDEIQRRLAATPGPVEWPAEARHLSEFPTPLPRAAQTPPAAEATAPPVSEAAPAGKDARQAQRSEEILALASRLYSQTAMLARQMEGPLPPRAGREVAAPRGADEFDLLRLEEELLRSLDQILELRRKLALLNERERESANTIRELLMRLELTASPPAEDAETGLLASHLAEVDAIIERITERLPRISVDIQENLRRMLQRGG